MIQAWIKTIPSRMKKIEAKLNASDFELNSEPKPILNRPTLIPTHSQPAYTHFQSYPHSLLV